MSTYCYIILVSLNKVLLPKYSGFTFIHHLCTCTLSDFKCCWWITVSGSNFSWQAPKDRLLWWLQKSRLMWKCYWGWAPGNVFHFTYNNTSLTIDGIRSLKCSDHSSRAMLPLSAITTWGHSMFSPHWNRNKFYLNVCVIREQTSLRLM